MQHKAWGNKSELINVCRVLSEEPTNKMSVCIERELGRVGIILKNLLRVVVDCWEVVDVE